MTDVSELPAPLSFGETEVVHEFHRQMPTGVAVSDEGRVFVCYPRWGDDVPFTVAELVDGEEVPYPSLAYNTAPDGDPAAGLVSVQSVVVDPAGRLWLLDTGSIEMGETEPGGPKLVCVDLATDAVARTIELPRDAALPTTYLNDVRFDLRRGPAGMAFITDSGTSPEHPMGLIVVDLASGAAWRHLTGHPSVTPAEGHLVVIDGQPLPEIAMGSDGIAISADGARLFFCPLASRRLYSVATEALAAPDGDVEATLEDHGEKGGSDGLETDDQGRIYATLYEQGGVIRRLADGSGWEPVVQQPHLLFVDTLAVAADGHLYLTVNQLHRQAQYQGGVDRREPPYALVRTPIDAGPVRPELS